MIVYKFQKGYIPWESLEETGKDEEDDGLDGKGDADLHLVHPAQVGLKVGDIV